MYNMDNDIDKQSIVNELYSMNYFDNEDDNQIDLFNLSLYKKLNNNFPELMKNIDLEDMDYIIERFNSFAKFKKVFLWPMGTINPPAPSIKVTFLFLLL